MLFRDDLPIDRDEVGSPLGLPALDLAAEPFTVLYQHRLLLLRRAGADHRAWIWGHEYGLLEEGTAGQAEAAYRARHAAEIAAATAAWLGRVLPGVEPTAALQTWGEALVETLRQAIAAAYPDQSRPPRPTVGQGTVLPRADGALLEQLQGFERVLLLDGKLYDLLTVPEYLARFERDVDPGLFTRLVEKAGQATPQEVAALMTSCRDLIRPAAFHALKGKLHHDRRTFALCLDGAYLVPEHAGAASQLLGAHNRLLERSLKTEAVEPTHD